MKISFVIPNFNGQKLLEKNLPAVIAAGKKWGGKFEIIVVDDTSSDDSVQYLKKNFPQVIIITHIKNLRFAASCNDGVDRASGELVLLLNNDVRPDTDFIKPLVNHFTDKRVFAVGCLERSLKGDKVTESGRSQGKFERGFLVHNRSFNQNLKTTLWASCGSAIFRKSIWEELAGLDLLFAPAYWEDIDICYRALKADYKVQFEPASIVTHQHETTNRLFFNDNEIKIMAFKNQLLFVWKNIADRNYLRQHFLWLPYHLTVSTFLTNGLFLAGFIKAFYQLPRALRSRSRVRSSFKLSDNDILRENA